MLETPGSVEAKAIFDDATDLLKTKYQVRGYSGVWLELEHDMTDDRSILVSILTLARLAQTQRERQRLFELAERWSSLARQDSIKSGAGPLRRAA